MEKQNKKAVVTGGAGFIGSHLAKRLLDEGFEVAVVDNLSTGKKENLDPRAAFFEGDVRDAALLAKAFSGAQFVFHLAAIPAVPYSIEYPEETNEVNLGGTIAVLKAAADAKVKRVVYSSSSAVYGDAQTLPTPEASPIRPKSPYALQKYAGELYCRLFGELYGLETVCLRYFNVYGEGQSSAGAYASVIAKFLELTNGKKTLTIFGDGNQTRDFVHVADVVRANILAARSDRAGRAEAVNIGSGRKYSVNQIALIFGGPIERLPPRIEPKESLADISFAEFLLGWKPETPLEKGLGALLQNRPK